MVHTAVAIVIVRVALWSVPFPALYRHLQRRRERLIQTHTTRQRRSVQHILRLVRGVSRVVPKANCLVQALTAEQLLARAGYVTTLRLGVAEDEGRALTAHAWLEHAGQVILGGSAAPHRFSPLLPGTPRAG